MTQAQYFSYRDDWLFTEVMTEKVYFLETNYYVKAEQFKALLTRVQVGKPSQNDARHLMKLHHTFYKKDKEFKDKIKNHEKRCGFLLEDGMWPIRTKINL